MSILLFFVLLIVFIGAIVAGIILLKKNEKNTGYTDYTPPAQSNAQKQSNLAYNAYLPTPVWSDFTPNTTPDGQCLNYTISSSQFTAEFPSLNSLNLGQGRGYISSDQACLDPDQIFAQSGSHTCLYNNNGSANSGCYLTVSTPLALPDIDVKPPGTLVPRNVVEGVPGYPLYMPCNIQNTSTTIAPQSTSANICDGTIGIIAPSFTPIANINQPESLCSGPPSTVNNCISIGNIEQGGNYYETVLQECSLGDFNQIFRITRYSLDNEYNLNQDPNGILASIVFRTNGYYLAPNLFYDPTTKSVQFDRLRKNGPLSVSQGKDTVDLVLLNPKLDQSRQGVYWLLQPQLIDPAYDPATVPPQQYFGCNVLSVPEIQQIAKCDINGLPPFYAPPSGASGGSYSADSPISPQQFVYIPNFRQIPDPTDASGYWTYLTNQYSIVQINDSLSALQLFRTTLPVTIEYETCASPNASSDCVKQYTTGDFPIRSDSTKVYPDTQFLSYVNIRSDVTTGVSPVCPGCKILSDSYANILYNPIVSGNFDLITTPANTTS